MTSVFQQVQDQVQWRADLLLAGRFAEMRGEYLFPLPIYLGHRMVALRDAAEAVQQAQAVHHMLQRRQIDALAIKVRAVEVPHHTRFRVWADWNASSRITGQSRQMRLIYYMCDTGNGYKTEMLHYAPRLDSLRRADAAQRQRA